MILMPNCFVDEGIKHPDKVINKLNKGSLIKGYYIVSLNEESGRFEIISSRMFFQKYFKEREYKVSALLKTKEDAFEYIRCLSELSYGKFNDFNPREIIKSVDKEEIAAIFDKENE